MYQNAIRAPLANKQSFITLISYREEAMCCWELRKATYAEWSMKPDLTKINLIKIKYEAHGKAVEAYTSLKTASCEMGPGTTLIHSKEICIWSLQSKNMMMEITFQTLYVTC